MERNTMKYKVKQYLMFAGVSTVLFCAVVIVPFIYGLYLTFTSWDGVSKEKPFVGLANYISTFQDAAYWQALGRTLVYSVIAVILVNVVAFFLAYLLTSGIKGQNFFRAGFFIPNLIGGIVLGYVWKFVFNRAFVALGKSLSIGALSTSWLATTNGAMACLIIVSVWQYAGYMMLIYVAGFMSVSKSLMEAAQIDGAGYLKSFFKISLPSASPAIITVSLFSFVWYWNESYLTQMYVSGVTTKSGWSSLVIKLGDFASNYSDYAQTATTAVTSINESINMAGTMLSILPLLVMYFVLVESIDRTGITGE